MPSQPRGDEARDPAASADRPDDAAPQEELTILRKLADPALYYWSIRRPLWWEVRQWFRSQRQRKTQREIRLLRRGSYQTAHRDGAAWNVKLPNCCVVCGGLPHESFVMVSGGVEDITWPLLGPLLGLALGGLLSAFSIWWMPLLLMLGLMAGYLLRRKKLVNVRLRRCSSHRTPESLPSMFAFAGTLSIRTGSARVRQEFDEQNSLAASLRAAGGEATDEEKQRRAAYEASLRGRTGRRLSDAAALTLQLVAIGLVLAATPWVFKYTLAEYGKLAAWGVSLSLVYLIVGAVVLQFCCKLFASGTPDYPLAMFGVFVALVVWNGVIGLLSTTSPPQIPADMQDPSLVFHAAAYFGGIGIFLFVVPSLVYLWLLDVDFGAALLIFTIQHIVTLLAAGGVLLTMVAYF